MWKSDESKTMKSKWLVMWSVFMVIVAWLLPGARDQAAATGLSPCDGENNGCAYCVSGQIPGGMACTATKTLTTGPTFISCCVDLYPFFEECHRVTYTHREYHCVMDCLFNGVPGGTGGTTNSHTESDCNDRTNEHWTSTICNCPIAHPLDGR
jgi:hypothetical protein